MLGIVIHVVVNANALKDLREHHVREVFAPVTALGTDLASHFQIFEFEDVAYLNLMSLNHLPHDIRSVFHRAKNRVCQCDPEWTGPDCRERLCPYGDDPRTDVTTMKKGTQNSEKDEIQQISLAANGPIFGSMLLEFETYHRQKYHTIPLFFPSRLYSDTLSFSGSVVRDPWRQLNIFEVGDFNFLKHSLQ